MQLRELVGALPAAPGEAASEQGQWMATQREAGGGVIEGDGFVFRSLEQIGLFVRALDDRGVGEQGVAVDALLAGCGPELMAAVAASDCRASACASDCKSRASSVRLNEAAKAVKPVLVRAVAV